MIETTVDAAKVLEVLPDQLATEVDVEDVQAAARMLVNADGEPITSPQEIADFFAWLYDVPGARARKGIVDDDVRRRALGPDGAR